MRALVIDDSTLSRHVCRAHLERCGFAVEEALDGGAALAILARDQSYDLAVFDWHMLPVTGYAFARAVRAQPMLDAVRLVLLTAESSAAYHRQALHAGAQAVLVKPLTAAGLTAALARVGMLVPPTA